MFKPTNQRLENTINQRPVYTTNQRPVNTTIQSNTTQSEKYTLHRDKYIDNFINNINGIANKLLRGFLNDKFNEIYQMNDDTDEIKAMKNYKVTTRLLGGLSDDYGEPDIKRKITNLSTSKDEVDNQRYRAFEYIRKNWLEKYFTPNNNEEYPFVAFHQANVSTFIKTNMIMQKMKTKLTSIIEKGEGKQSFWNPLKQLRGGKTKKKRSKKNYTRRKH